MTDLTPEEREVLRCMSQAWMEDEMRIPGGVCYNDAISLLNKAGLPESAAAVEGRLLLFQRLAGRSVREQERS